MHNYCTKITFQYFEAILKSFQLQGKVWLPYEDISKLFHASPFLYNI